MVTSLTKNVLLVDGLKHNLLSISQLYDKGLKVFFEPSYCIIKDIQSNLTIFMGHMSESVHTIDIEKIMVNESFCSCMMIVVVA